ncbi:hypothetical protein K458DRAFT_444484 [Lentithecium fluviatile CBS 122367]|uniref:BRCT domain-containing protein n=1 Tax=Lentithecium fluviatile CBS 122367 TaxID=1168545 RepID=A0A6G1ITL4_9PLEO|nr:hypothetical protein K458DRAFT_444484 [Lentithecium fluviatile CBS 122367]
MGMDHGGHGTSQMPLAGAILCCTSIPPEQRTELGTIGAQMGATIKLDLTSDVTHLIVGNTGSAKYRYVAKSRADVKVLLPGWLEAMRTEWIKGGDVDVAALEHEYRLPTFYGLRICLTGFDNHEQRKYIQDTVSQNGAEYHGDLTKSVTHLIAATPSGKKYEHAVNWRMKIVTLEWFEQSRERGLALDESYYHPSMPIEERGKGAWVRRQTTPPTVGKRARGAGQTDMANLLRRKLRRSASSRMGSQSEALWAGITSAGLEQNKDEADEWTEPSVAQQEPQPAHAAADEATGLTHGDAVPREDPASRARGPFADELDGIFAGAVVYPHGFDQSKTNILREHLDGNGAIVIRDATELNNFTSDDLRRGYLVVPHDVPISLATLPEGAGDLTLVTNWWVERCLHGKSLVDPTDSVLCRPFENLSISGFNGLTINITGFTGIELLQVTKAITLFGATYDEMLSMKTSVMICNSRKPNPEKLRFSTEKGIPAVHAAWLWECIRSSHIQPYDKHLLSPAVFQPQKAKPRASFAEVPTAPLSEEDSIKLKQKRAQASKQASKSRGGLQRQGTLELSLCTPVSTTGSSANPNASTDSSIIEQDAQLTGAYDGAGSLPLQDINPRVDLPRRPSTSSNGSTHPNTQSNSTRSNSVDGPLKHAPAQRRSRLAREPTPDSVIPAANTVAPSERDTPALQEPPKPPPTDYSDIMANLLANRKPSVPADKDAEPGRRRRKPLGRAQSSRSNQSTADNPLSRQSSISYAAPDHAGVGEEEDGEMVRKPVEVPQPSQELGWDSPGAQKAREKMILAMGGKVDGGLNMLKGIGVVKDRAVDEGLGSIAGRTSRKRRG